RNDAEAGSVSAGPRKIVDEPGGDRIADDRHDDRYGPRRVLERLRSRRSSRHDRVDIEPHELGSEFRQPLDPVLPPSPLDRDRLSLGITESLQSLPERSGAKRKGG